MKFLHTADLHIGKKLFEVSLIEDQRNILHQICHIAMQEKVDALVIAGDVYDRSVPPTEAVTLLNDFLTSLQAADIPVIMISGNHDSPERVAFADAILEKQGLFIAGSYRTPLKTVILQDTYGPVEFVCMPFVKPAVVGESTSAAAVKRMLEERKEQSGIKRRVLLTHYFVAGDNGRMPELSESETDAMVGGLDCVPVSLLADFSYVALGHIHKPQKMGTNVYYSGSPLKYSFSEARDAKGVNVVTLDGEGRVEVARHLLSPVHELRCIRGRLAELMSPEVTSGQGSSLGDYLQVTLTDREELLEPMGTLRSVYPNVLQILWEKKDQAVDTVYESRLHCERRSIPELFGEFYEMLWGQPLDETRRQMVEEAAEKAGEEV